MHRLAVSEDESFPSQKIYDSEKITEAQGLENQQGRGGKLMQTQQLVIHMKMWSVSCQIYQYQLVTFTYAHIIGRYEFAYVFICGAGI